MFKKFLRALNQHLEEYLIALFLIAITFCVRRSAKSARPAKLSSGSA